MSRVGNGSAIPPSKTVSGWGKNTRKRCFQWLGAALGLFLLLISGTAQARELRPPTNYFYETGALFDISDPVLDDKGPGYYQYPLDRSIPRGAYDLKRFTVYEEGDVLTFTIQMREYILTDTRKAKYGADQGFVGQTFDIYIDKDGKPGSGYNRALPAREIEFADGHGWEKAILLTPLSHYRVYDLLQGKTDDLEFQDWIPDIILPDYVQIQADKIILRVNKSLLGPGDPQTWGYQVFVMGFAYTVSTHQCLNMDVRAFSAKNNFGGGWDTYGDPPIMDCIMPEGEDQRQYLREYKSEPFGGEIVRAVLPFVYPNPKPEFVPPPAPTPKFEPVAKPAIKLPEVRPPDIEFSESPDAAFPPVVKSIEELGLPQIDPGKFVPIKQSKLAKSKTPEPGGFIPIER